MAESSREPRDRPRTQTSPATRATRAPAEQDAPATPTATGARAATGAPVTTGAPAATGTPVAPAAPPRTERYLVAAVPAHLSPYGAVPEDPSELADRLAKDEEITVLRVITPQRRAGVTTAASYPPIVVVETTPERAAALATVPHLHVEVDHPLMYGDAGLVVADPGTVPVGDGVQVTFRVTDDDGRPLAGAAVYLLSAVFPGWAGTGADGRAVLTVPADAVTTATGVLVQPRTDCWSSWTGAPRLTLTGENPLICQRIGDGTRSRWSSRAMGFDRLPPTYRGHGVRIALIDSGVATGHPDLADRITAGLDVVNADEKSWQEDHVGVGTHVAALVAATNGARITGLAPEVDLYAYKVAPGGRYSDLIEAVDHAVAAEVDVIHLGVGGRHPSWLVAWIMDEARRAGVACVAAAGNTAGPVLFPASLPGVLAVAAVGLLGTFPPDSHHATEPTGPPALDGLFSPRFTARGPEVDVCAPGVAVIAASAAGGVTAIDGTATAAAHVAALAALVLAHHQDFRAYRGRDALRVDQLYHLLRSACRPVGLPDGWRTGAGLPDAVVAVGLVPGPVAAPAPAPFGPAGTVAPFGPAPTATPFGPAPLPPSLPLIPAGVAPTPSMDPLGQLRAALRAAGLLAAG